jgi:regulator of sigma E protease
MSFIIEYIFPFLFILTVLVFVHEMGHFLLARRNGVFVEVFSIGFGPELFGFTDTRGTRWKFSAIPLGGYVKMLGEGLTGDAEEDASLSEEERESSFQYKPLAQRAAVVAAGPIANFIFAIAVFFAIFTAIGSPIPLAGVGQIQAQSAAEEAGFASGDKILTIDGVDVTTFEDLRDIVSINAGVTLEFSVLRNEEEIPLKATPKLRTLGEGENAKEVGLLGIGPDPEQVIYETMPLFKAAMVSVERTYSISLEILAAVGEIIMGERTAEELGGPIRIAQISGEMAQGGISNLLFFMAVLSINLGLINLFPIPMLDGGHLVFYFVEAIQGHPLNPRVQEYSFRFGLILVLLLMVYATWNDLVQLKVFELLGELFT